MIKTKTKPIGSTAQLSDRPVRHPDRLSSYFRRSLLPLTAVTLSGLIYNVGLTAGPYFEGRLAQCLYDIIKGTGTTQSMITLAVIYVLTILTVQCARCVKRFYIRRFANDTGRNMRRMLYNHLVHTGKAELENEGVGTLMTKAVADVDACAEGMRKFTTEVFDTGIALVSYLVMLFAYDWRLALISCAFTPIAYIIAEKLKTVVYKYNSAYKKSAGALNDATMDRVSNAITYRVNGRESDRDAAYERSLSDYESRAVMANVWVAAPQPIYNVISMLGVLLIIWIGSKNVTGGGFASWDIAAFTTFMSCFAKMAIKSSKAAKLFNSVQKAEVSWKRLKPLMHEYREVGTVTDIDFDKPKALKVRNLGFAYPGSDAIFSGLSFDAAPGEVIGITGPVACGKSTLGSTFLCENPYSGSITLGKDELSEMSEYERSMSVSYMGHAPELMSDTIADNIRLGDTRDITPYLSAVCLDDEVLQMPEHELTRVGDGGIRLSGGQQSRLALARTLYNKRKLIILDDPMSAVDRKTERTIIQNIRQATSDSVVLIISHRVTEFPGFDRVIYMDDGRCIVGTHAELMRDCPNYAEIYNAQAGGEADE